MTDLAGSSDQQPTPAQPVPVAASVDLDALKREFQEQADKRVAGVQSALGKQLAAMKTEFEKKYQVRSGFDPDDDAADSRISELQAKLQAAEMDAALARASRAYPDESPVLEAILATDDPTERLAYLRAARSTWSAPVTPPAPTPPQVPTPPVDPNNPMRQPDVQFASESGADDYLRQFSGPMVNYLG